MAHLKLSKRRIVNAFNVRAEEALLTAERAQAIVLKLSDPNLVHLIGRLQRSCASTNEARPTHVWECLDLGRNNSVFLTS